MYSIGVDIGGSKIAAGVVGEDMKLVCKKSTPFPHTGNPMDSVDVIKTMIDAMLAEQSLKIADARCIGLAVPGSIDYDLCSVVHAYNLDYHDFMLGDIVQGLYPGTKVLVENDANAAALAEYYCGAFRGHASGLVITIGTGIGGGLVTDGKLFIGGMKHGFEFGHATLIFGGEKCTCGHDGCIEAYCSAAALVREGRCAAEAHPESALFTRAQGDLKKINAKLVMDCARAGDEQAVGIYHRYTDYLGAATCTAIALFDPEVIAFGGGVSNDGEFLLAPIRAYAEKYAFFRTHAKIVTAEMRNDAGIVGAAMLYLQR
ncbi:MAG TPA: ROK family protein [Eubacteriales bacterium]|nr:ROK family protein [Eubacteriales bacterium]